MMIRIFTITAFFVLTGLTSVQAEQTDSISKKCEKEICYPCCIATCGRQEKESFGYQPVETPAAAPVGEAIIGK